MRLLIVLLLLFALVFAHGAHPMRPRRNLPPRRANRIYGRFSKMLGPRASNTALKAIIKKDGLNVALKDVIPQIVQDLKSMKLDDITGTTHVSLIGDVTYNLTGIHITNVQIGSFQVTMQPPSTVGAILSGVTVGLSLNFVVEQKSWPHAKFTGSADATAKDSQITVAVAVTLGSDGKPILKTQTSTVAFGNLDVTVHGSVAWLINLLEGLFKGTIKNAAQQAISQTITQQIDVTLNQQIKQVDFVIPIPNQTLAFDASLTEITVAADFLAIGSKATLINTKTHEQPPYTPVPLPSTPSTNQTAQVYVTEYIANAAGYSAFKAGALLVNVTPEMIPKEVPVQLNTTSLKYMIPELYAKFPNQLIQLTVSASQPPQATFGTLGISGTGKGVVLFSVINADKSLTKAFILGIEGQGSVSQMGARPFGKNLNITGKIDSLTATVTLQETYIGPVNVTNMNSLVKILILGFLPVWNKQLAQGVTVPLPANVTVVNPQLVTGANWFEVAADIDYNPGVQSDAARSSRMQRVHDILVKIRMYNEDLEKLEAELQTLLQEEHQDKPGKIRVN